MVNIIQPETIADLPLPAIVAFAARCARRVQKLYQVPKPVYDNARPRVKRQDTEHNSAVIEMAICFAEQFAQLTSPRADGSFKKIGVVAEAGNKIRKHAINGAKSFRRQPHESGLNDAIVWYDRGIEEHAQYVLKAANAARACRAAHEARRCARAAALKQHLSAAKAASNAAQAAAQVDDDARECSGWEHSNAFRKSGKGTIRKELKLLLDAANREKWTDETPVFPHFFSPDSPIERQVMLAINDLCVSLCKLIAVDRRALNRIDWRLLEQTVAVALEGIGFQITLTPGSKDGGKDIIATCTLRGVRRTYYLEIKHWRSGKTVSSGDISHFVEVNVEDGTDGGLFLSSSGYAPSVFSQLSEITRKRVRLGSDSKIVSLCQHFVQQRHEALWKPKEVLPRVLFDNTYGDFQI